MTALQTEQAHPPLVNIDDVWVCYGEKWVLKSIYLKCFAGEILGIVGPNGGGKTTLLKVILGTVTPDRGSVTLFGQPPNKRSRLNIGYLPQISHADRSFPVTVLDVVLMGIYNKIGLLHRVDRKNRTEAMALLEQVNMAEHAHTNFGSLSGGQQQRVNIARALASQPKLLVLDEPSTGVDSVAQEDFYELLVTLRDEHETSVILVSHDIGVITSHADQIACLNTQIHYHGKPDVHLTPEVQQKIFGKDLHIMIHDDKCLTCFKRHENHD
jgi:zinc transport system ATP-binding protein